jgi:transposase-like protein
METFETQTRAEVAAEFRCSPRKVSEVARKHGIGADLGGRAGWRFTEADKARLWAVMKPAKAKPTKPEDGRIRKGRRSAA